MKLQRYILTNAIISVCLLSGKSKETVSRQESYGVLYYRGPSFVSPRAGNIKSVTDEERALYLFSQNESMRPRAPLIESAPTETARAREKARTKRHGLRIIALLYSRSRSYRRTRTRPRCKCAEVDARELRRD